MVEGRIAGKRTLVPSAEGYLGDMEIANRANHLAAHVCNQELSAALVRAGAECGWAQFRRGTGGAYWVPAANAERFRGLLDRLESLRARYGKVLDLGADADAFDASAFDSAVGQ